MHGKKKKNAKEKKIASLRSAAALETGVETNEAFLFLVRTCTASKFCNFARPEMSQTLIGRVTRGSRWFSPF